MMLVFPTRTNGKYGTITIVVHLLNPTCPARYPKEMTRIGNREESIGAVGEFIRALARVRRMSHSGRFPFCVVLRCVVLCCVVFQRGTRKPNSRGFMVGVGSCSNACACVCVSVCLCLRLSLPGRYLPALTHSEQLTTLGCRSMNRNEPTIPSSIKFGNRKSRQTR